MFLFFFDKRSIIYRLAALTVLFFFAHLDLSAQSTVPLPDSVQAVGDSSFDSGISVDTSLVENKNVVADPITLRIIPDSVVRGYKKDKIFEYANDPEYWKTEPVKENGFLENFIKFLFSKGVRYFVYLLIALALLFTLYKIIVDNKIYLFYRSPKKNQEAGETALELQQEDFDARINEAMSLKDYRLAIRWMYLKTLQLLDRNGLIQFHPQTTNYEYLLQLKNHSLNKDFSLLTHAYDYVWYGQFEVNQAQADTLKTNFDHFYKAMGH
jgi:hypothetical protein